jgi:hypothetical protein
MKMKMKMTSEGNHTLAPVAFAAALALIASSISAMGQQAGDGNLKQAKVIIEHNATDNDTGFQVALDAEGWEKMEIIGPSGVIVEFTPKGTVNELGITELFLETVEPENAKMPLDELFKKMPEGDYQFRATASRLGGKSGMLVGTAKLTHNIPAGVALLEPKEKAVIPLGDTKVKWQGTDKAIDGSPIKIIGYQLIVERDEEPHPRMIGKRGLSMYLPASVNEIKLPADFFASKTSYLWEVLAIEEGGNQTLQSGTFKTQ